MRDRTFAFAAGAGRQPSWLFKVGAGVGIVLATSLVLMITTRCGGGCDGQSISASDAGPSTTEAAMPQASAPSAERESLTVSPLAVPLVDDMPHRELLAFADGLPPVTVPADGSSTSAVDGSTTSADGAGPAGDGSSTTVVAGGTTVVTDGSGGDGASTTQTTAAPTTNPAPTTTAPLPAPVPVDSVPANGQVFYVSSTSGSDANDGTSSSRPWKSLRAALKRIRAGQTLLIMNGEYRENKAPGVAHYAVDIGGTADNWVKIAAAPGHSPSIVANNGTGLLIHVPYVEVSGLTIKGSGFNKDNHWGVGIAITDTHHVRLVGNRISNFPVSGISATKSSNFHIIGNDVGYNSFWSPLQGSGISVWRSTNRGFGADSAGYHDRIVGNRVYGNENKVFSGHYDYNTITDGNGIIIDRNQDTGYSGRTLVANNLVYDNGGRGIIVWMSDRVDIMFNTAYQNGQTDGIAGGATELAAGRASDILMANNVGWARSGLPAIIFDRVSNGRSYANVLVTDKPSGHASGNDVMHSGNPGFRNPSTNPGAADFRPTSSSVLKGRAENTPWYIGTDLVGTSRKSGTPDVGAFEAEASRR